ncbi:MAG: hypothetical protein R3B96_19815 [Pirellulaceae bacterium]
MVGRATATFLRQTEERIAALGELPEQKPLARFLEARILLQDTGELPDEAIVSLLSEAAEADPDQLAYWGTLAATLALVKEDPATSDAWLALFTRALDRAVALDGSNLFLLDLRLQEQILNESPEALATVDRLIEVVEPLWIAMRKEEGPNSPLFQMRELKQALEASDFDRASFLGAHLQQSQERGAGAFYLRSQSSHGASLDFLLHGPSPPLEARFRSRKPENGHPVRLTWEAPRKIEIEAAGVIEVVAADYDLNRTLDLATLTNEALTVWLFDESGAVTESLRWQLPSGFEPRGMVVVDLDQDDLAKEVGADEGPAMSGMGAEMAPAIREADPTFPPIPTSCCSARPMSWSSSTPTTREPIAI